MISDSSDDLSELIFKNFLWGLSWLAREIQTMTRRLMHLSDNLCVIHLPDLKKNKKNFQNFRKSLQLLSERHQFFFSLIYSDVK